MKIGIIGPGRVGTALAEAFKIAGYEIVGIVSRMRESAQKCMRLTHCNYWSANPQDIAKVADIILITVPDAEIKNIAQSLSNNNIMLVHTSGTLDASILGAKESLSMHPICSFAGGKLPRGTYFGIEGAIKIGERLVKSIDGIPIIISQELKPLYHAALNFGASYILTLLNTGCKLLAESGIKEPEKVILSLATSTLRNAKRFGIQKSLTGAIERGDMEVLRKELNAIEKISPEKLKFYKILAKEIQKMITQVKCKI